MNQEVNFDKEARRELQKGVDTLADAAKVTLGAKGRNVIIDREPFPHVTKDGVTVVNSINLNNRVQNMGAKLIKQVASKTADDSGDGTTSSSVLAQSIINKGLDSLEKGANPIDVNRGINMAVKEIVHFLKGKATPIGDDYELLKQVARISANGDEEIAELVADVMSKVKADGLITVDKSGSTTTKTDIVEGTKILSGMADLKFTTNFGKMRSELEDALVLMVEGDIEYMKDLMPVLQVYDSMNTNLPLVIFANRTDGEALFTLVGNHVNGNLKSLVVNLPGLNEEKMELLHDLQSIVGGKVIKKSLGELDNFDASMFGKANKVISALHDTIITGDGEGKEARVNVIREQIELYEDDDLRKKYFQGRLARLNGGVASIFVGGVTEGEMNERKDRIDDAVGATRAAMMEGIVPGGGVSLMRAKEVVAKLKSENKDIQLGINIIHDSLDAPISQILENAGLEYSKKKKVLESMEFSKGFDVRAEEVTDMIESGIIDPFKVVRNSIENSSSVAGLFLTTACVISNK